MKTPVATLTALVLLSALSPAQARVLAVQAPAPAVQSSSASDAPDPAVTVRRVCMSCHNNQALRGNLSLEGFDVGFRVAGP